MSDAQKGQVMTANRLRDGDVVFLNLNGNWVEGIDDASLATDAGDVATLEAKALSDVKATLVTGQYLFEASVVEGKLRADHFRERIRTLGPSVRKDLGKQAEGTGGAFEAVEA